MVAWLKKDSSPREPAQTQSITLIWPPSCVTTATDLRGGVAGLPAVACSIWVATSWMRFSVLSLPPVVLATRRDSLRPASGSSSMMLENSRCTFSAVTEAPNRMANVTSVVPSARRTCTRSSQATSGLSV